MSLDLEDPFDWDRKMRQLRRMWGAIQQGPGGVAPVASNVIATEALVDITTEAGEGIAQG